MCSIFVLCCSYNCLFAVPALIPKLEGARAGSHAAHNAQNMMYISQLFFTVFVTIKLWPLDLTFNGCSAVYAVLLKGFTVPRCDPAIPHELPLAHADMPQDLDSPRKRTYDL